MKPLTTKTKKPSRKSLVKSLDALWSLAVRQLHPKCVMCEKTETLQAHHCIKRKGQGEAVRWLIHNGISLCYPCHIHKLHGRQADYAWIERYTRTIAALIPEHCRKTIEDLANSKPKFSIDELIRLKSMLTEVVYGKVAGPTKKPD